MVSDSIVASGVNECFGFTQDNVEKLLYDADRLKQEIFETVVQKWFADSAKNSDRRFLPCFSGRNVCRCRIYG